MWRVQSTEHNYNTLPHTLLLWLSHTWGRGNMALVTLTIFKSSQFDSRFMSQFSKLVFCQCLQFRHGNTNFRGTAVWPIGVCVSVEKHRAHVHTLVCSDLLIQHGAETIWCYKPYQSIRSSQVYLPRPPAPYPSKKEKLCHSLSSTVNKARLSPVHVTFSVNQTGIILQGILSSKSMYQVWATIAATDLKHMPMLHVLSLTHVQQLCTRYHVNRTDLMSRY